MPLMLGLAWLVAGCGRPAATPAEPLVRVHFAGTAAAAGRLADGPLREVWQHPETRALAAPLARRLAERLAPAWGRPVDALLPVAEDLLARGGLVDWHGPDGGHAMVLAAPADPAAAARWQDALGAAPAVTNGFLFAAARGGAEGALAGARAALVRLATNGALFTAEVRVADVLASAGLAKHAPLGGWPVRAGLRVTPRRQSLALAGDLDYGRPVTLPAGDWRLPVELLAEPMLSFTAARGFGDWLRGWIEGRGFPAPAAAEQAFAWSQAGLPWQSFAAVTSADPAAEVQGLKPEALAAALNRLDLHNVRLGLRVTNEARRVELLGLPFLSPFLEARPLREAGFLTAGLFPLPPTTNAAPQELLAQVRGRTNLVYYNWETTGARLVFPAEKPGAAGRTNDFGRLDQWRQLTQFLTLVGRDPRELLKAFGPEVPVPGAAWMTAVGPLLGDSVTEVTQAAPDRLEFRRSSRTGLTGAELVRLFAWLTPPRAAAPPAPPAP